MEHIWPHRKGLSNRQIRANGLGCLAGLEVFPPETFRCRLGNCAGVCRRHADSEGELIIGSFCFFQL